MVLACCSSCVKMVQCLYPKKTFWPLLPLGLRYFFVSASWQKVSSPKSNREALIRLNRENLRLYGPLLKSRKNQNAEEELDLESRHLDSSKPKKKSLKKSGNNSEDIAKRSETLTETSEHSSRNQLKKSKRSPSKLPDILPVDTSGVNPVEQKTCEFMADLALPVNWEEILSDFIFQQTLTVSNSDWHNSNMVYKNILNLLKVKKLPSVTSILNKTLSPVSRLLLQQWKARMIREMGTTDFQKYQEELKKNGSNFHLYIQRILSDEDVEESDLHFANEGHWKSLKSLMPHITNVCALETEVTHQNLLYRGAFDCVAKYDDVLCLIDWKTSLKQKPLIANTYDNPLQVAAYISALNTTTLLDVQITNAVIVIAYRDGTPADVHFMDEKLCHHYWQEWKRRLLEYWTLVGSLK